MSPDSSQKKKDRLARVRENQRKSRAKKQEYLQELEQKLVTCQNEARQRDIAHRLALQKVEAENRHLKTLLGSLGISTELLQQYVQLADQGAAIDRKVAIPAMQRSANTSSTEPANEGESFPPSDRLTKKALAEGGQVHDPIAGATKKSADEDLRSPDPPLCKCAPGERDLASGPVDGDVLNTTLCAIAEELISQYNTRGTDLEEIRQRLWAGFQSGVTGDGCRVQNTVLFQVLDEISHDI
ncbi:hypothetical protein N7532_010560 [Penicillium argentinense]|uniref:BZIP domain-containing protein n=1 Tax=Penicillium argentinense TaxID=1131581 RepID=A0A9W9EQ10_9EURO|nr:uncharacterized protein N7532_010560 [Penicillium argentinense]KAJ5085789.1 hypothetical protein N7532_010560 [Penicillium argentinense]